MFTSLGELPKPVLGQVISTVFLDVIGCPHNASDITFTIGANGTLKCTATVWEGSPPVQAQREWEVLLKTSDAFYKVLIGAIK